MTATASHKDPAAPAAPPPGAADGTTTLDGAPDEGYHRALSNRQVQMMAIGSAIGVGLFYGSGGGIAMAGPAILAAYAAAGIIAYLVMRALGEMIIYRPTSGSFMDYAEEFLGPTAGYATGWTYWMGNIACCMAEVTAAGHYLAYWFPSLPVWLAASVVLVALLAANLLSVKLFGEMEFWFASIKVLAIVFMIALGLVILLFGVTSLRHDATVANLYNHGGFAPHGWGQVALAMQSVFFAYTGIELVGSTAGEVENPKRSLRAAINLLPVRIGIFYLGSLFIVLSLNPWTAYNSTFSPFVQVFTGIGLPAAAGIMNFVVLTAALSSCNANMYNSSRIMRRLATYGQAPSSLSRLSGRSVPAAALALGACAIALGIVVNVVSPDHAFTYITSFATCAFLWAWGVILVCNLRYRGAVRRGELPVHDFRMPGAPYTNWLVLAVMAAIVVLLAKDPSTRVPLYAGLVFAVVLLAARRLTAGRPRVGANT